MLKSLRFAGLEFDEEAYTLVQPTFEGCFNAMMRYDKPQVELPVEACEYARDSILSTFRPYFETCPYCPEEEMEWNRKASPGHFFKSVFGLKTTGDILDSEHLMDEMRAFSINPTFPTLWVASVKEELLPRKKVLENVPRTFIIPDKRQHYLNQMLFHKQHDLFVRLGALLTTFMLSGSSMFYRGFTRIMQLLQRYKYKFAGDVSKWDSSNRMAHYEYFSIPLRLALFAPEGNTNRERALSKEIYTDLVYASYDDMVFSYVLLPTGEVIRLPCGMNSGDARTTGDNTIVHRGVTMAVEFMVMRTYAVEIESLWLLYSDDHGACTNCVELTQYVIRRDLYELLGFELKESDDFVSESTEGMTLLGFKAHYSEDHGCYVPRANVERLCCMLSRPKRAIDPIMQFARLNACRILTYFNPEGVIFKQLVLDFWNQEYQAYVAFEPGSSQQKEFEDLCQPWTDSQVEHLWLGYESRGVGLKNKLVEHHDFDQDQESPFGCPEEGSLEFQC